MFTKQHGHISSIHGFGPAAEDLVIPVEFRPGDPERYLDPENSGKNLDRWLEIAPGLADCVERAYSGEDSKSVCPPPIRVFHALRFLAPEEVRAVILGQDPYHTPGKASGLAFGYRPDYTGPLDSSLKNILAEVGIENPTSYQKSLEGWAKQGVLLLNTCLTVAAGSPLSHSELGWQEEVKNIVLHLHTLHGERLVFVNFGGEAQRLCKPYHGVSINTSHPCDYSNTSGNNPHAGSRWPERVNWALAKLGERQINWKGDGYV